MQKRRCIYRIYFDTAVSTWWLFYISWWVFRICTSIFGNTASAVINSIVFMNLTFRSRNIFRFSLTPQILKYSAINCFLIISPINCFLKPSVSRRSWVQILLMLNSFSTKFGFSIDHQFSAMINFHHYPLPDDKLIHHIFLCLCSVIEL